MPPFTEGKGSEFAFLRDDEGGLWKIELRKRDGIRGPRRLRNCHLGFLAEIQKSSQKGNYRHKPQTIREMTLPDLRDRPAES